MLNIAIDGFAGCGKTTLSKMLAEKLGLKRLDTGAIFRAFGYAYEKAGFEDFSLSNLEKFVADVDLKVKFVGGEQKIFVGGKDVTPFLRTESAGQMASKISQFPQIREKYLKIAQDFAERNDCIMEGRDIGSVVMPNAKVKIFLTADKNVRAKRRFDELVAGGKNVEFGEVLRELTERDKRDSERKEAPLKICDDSIVVDNTDMNIEQTFEFCLNLIEEIVAKKSYINIAIDGYAGSGKSTIAKELAKKLGFEVFDTGAIYRAIACAFEYMKCDESKISEKYIEKFAQQISIKVEFFNGVQHIFVNGIDHTKDIRTEKISELSAKISPFVCVREKVLQLQRQFAENNNVVMEGRDIGSHVLPNADFKFFCTADINVRAKRRFDQQCLAGGDVKFEDVLKELKERDFKDVNRENGALKQVADSIVLDTTNQTVEQSVEFCVNKVKKSAKYRAKMG